MASRWAVSRLFLLSGAMLLLLVACQPTSNPAAVGWEAVTRLPTARGELTAAVLGARIFVMGGMTGLGSSSDLVEAYDLESGEWSTLSPLPRPLNHPASATWQGTVYVMGGSEDFLRGSPLPGLYAYDVGNDEWERLADMPEGRWAAGAAASGGHLYVIGGTGGRLPSPVLIYDPRQNQWSEGAPLPTARDHLAVVAFAGRIYAIGGRSENRNLSAVEIYDPESDTWSEGAPLPTARSGMAAAVLDDRIYVIGGEDPISPDRVFPDNEAYDPVTDGWHRAPTPPTARHGVAGVAVRGKMYLVGGATYPGALSFLAWSDAVEALTPG